MVGSRIGLCRWLIKAGPSGPLRAWGPRIAPCRGAIRAPSRAGTKGCNLDKAPDEKAPYMYTYTYVYIYIYMYCMCFAIRPRQLRLGGWRLGVRGARFLSLGVLGGLCGVLGDTLVYLGVNFGPLGVP